jgi:hypothetical protein
MSSLVLGIAVTFILAIDHPETHTPGPGQGKSSSSLFFKQRCLSSNLSIIGKGTYLITKGKYVV